MQSLSSRLNKHIRMLLIGCWFICMGGWNILRSRFSANASRWHQCEPNLDCIGREFNPYVDHEKCGKRRSQRYASRIEWLSDSIAYSVYHLSHNGS